MSVNDEKTLPGTLARNAEILALVDGLKARGVRAFEGEGLKFAFWAPERRDPDDDPFTPTARRPSAPRVMTADDDGGDIP